MSGALVHQLPNQQVPDEENNVLDYTLQQVNAPRNHSTTQDYMLSDRSMIQQRAPLERARH